MIIWNQFFRSPNVNKKIIILKIRRVISWKKITFNKKVVNKVRAVKKIFLSKF